MRIIRVVITLALGRASEREPAKDGQAGGVDVVGIQVHLIANKVDIDIERSQEALNLGWIHPMRGIARWSLESASLKIHVGKVKGSAELLVLLVVVHDRVAEEMTVPVTENDPSIVSGDGEHLLQSLTADLFRHDVKCVVHTDNQRLTEARLDLELIPPFGESDNVDLQKVTVRMRVMLLAMLNESFIDVDPDSMDLCFLEVADHISSTTTAFQDTVIAALLRRFGNKIASDLIGLFKDTISSNRIMPS